jgi:hypothetical protein
MIEAMPGGRGSAIRRGEDKRHRGEHEDLAAAAKMEEKSCVSAKRLHGHHHSSA